MARSDGHGLLRRYRCYCFATVPFGAGQVQGSFPGSLPSSSHVFFSLEYPFICHAVLCIIVQSGWMSLWSRSSSELKAIRTHGGSQSQGSAESLYRSMEPARRGLQAGIQGWRHFMHSAFDSAYQGGNNAVLQTKSLARLWQSHARKGRCWLWLPWSLHEFQK